MYLAKVGELLKGSEFAKASKEIEHTFKIAEIETLLDLDNCVRSLPHNIGGVSTHQLVAFLREAQLKKVAAEAAKLLAAESKDIKSGSKKKE